MVIPSEPVKYHAERLSVGSETKYFSRNSQEVKACLVEDPDMRLRVSRYVTEVYAQYGYIERQPVLMIPDEVDPKDIYDKKKTKELVRELVRGQHGEEGVAKFEKGVVFIAKKQNEDIVGLIDVHEELQRTYVVTLGSGEILYSVRAIQRNGYDLPIQSLAKSHGPLSPPKIHTDSPEHQAILDNATVELSQLASSTSHIHSEPKIFRRAKQMAFNYLFYILFSKEKEIGVENFVAVLDKSQFENLNNVEGKPHRPNYGLVAIGPKAYYMGSDCIPTQITPRRIIESTGATHPELAAILAGRFVGPIIVPLAQTGPLPQIQN